MIQIVYIILFSVNVILTCTFNQFGKGWHMHSFENYCTEDKDIALEDKAYTVFLKDIRRKSEGSESKYRMEARIYDVINNRGR